MSRKRTEIILSEQNTFQILTCHLFHKFKQSFKKNLFLKEEDIVKTIFLENEKANGICGRKPTTSEQVLCVLEDAVFDH